MQVQRDLIRRLQSNETVVVRLQVDGQEVSWTVNVEDMRWTPGEGGYEFNLLGRILKADVHKARETG